MPRPGMTLVELLITIAILAILAALILGAATSATEAARRARTRSVVSKIHALVMERYTSYKTRRVDLHPQLVDWADQKFAGDPRLRGQVLADLRLLALRETMKLEMPDRWSDIIGADLGETPRDPVFLPSRPSLATLYLRRYQRLLGGDNDVLRTNQGAECLYLLVMHGTGDGEARTHFGEQDIGDTDEDGAKEFLDGWGNPISWLRWPAGFAFQSDIMNAPGEAGYDPEADHDPFDPFRRHQPLATPGPGAFSGLGDIPRYVVELRSEPRAFRLIPLIYSSGSDGVSDINTSRAAIVTGDPYWMNPYAIDPETDEYEFGFPRDGNDDGDNNSLDNVHNHLMDNQ